MCVNVHVTALMYVSACHTGTYVDFTLANGNSAIAPASAGVDVTDMPGSISCPVDCPAPSRGLFFTDFCDADPPADSVCLSDATANSCKLGTPPNCAPCPDHAYCTYPARTPPVPYPYRTVLAHAACALAASCASAGCWVPHAVPCHRCIMIGRGLAHYGLWLW